MHQHCPIESALNLNYPKVGTTIFARLFEFEPRKFVVESYIHGTSNELRVKWKGDRISVDLKFVEFLPDVPIDVEVMYEIQRLVDDGNYEHVQHTEAVAWLFDPLESVEMIDLLSKSDKENSYQALVQKIVDRSQ